MVDDHVLFCESFAASINFPNATTFCAFDLAEAHTICKKHAIHLAFVDARMPPQSGIQLIEEFRRHYPAIKIVGITSYDEEPTLLDFAHSGVQGILLKAKTRREQVNECNHTVINGGTYISDANLGSCLHETS